MLQARLSAPKPTPTAPTPWWQPKRAINPDTVTIKQAALKLSVFIRQMQVLLHSGVTLLHALRVLRGQSEDPVLGEVIGGVLLRVERGLSLSQAMSAYPRIFSKVAVGLVQSGETTGKLSEVMGKLADMLERDSNLVKKLSAALAYPALVITVTILLTLFVFYSILPNFIAIFREQNLKLPWITQMLVAITDGVRNPGCWMVAIGVIGVVWTFVKMQAATPKGAVLISEVVYQLPLIGSALHFGSLARFSWVMESMSGSGLPLLKSVEMASKASGSPILEQHGQLLASEIRDGFGMANYVKNHSQIYGKITGQMIAMAEESGGFEAIFGRLAIWFNQEMEARLDLLKATIEPVLMAVVATIVGVIVIGIFLPLYSLVGNLGV